MSIPAFPSELETIFQLAEMHRQTGDYAAALLLYQKIMTLRLSNVHEQQKITDALTAADIVIMERLADLTVLFGNTKAADSIYESMAELGRQAGNLYLADYTQLKRIHLALGSGYLHSAYDLLRTLGYRIGNVDAIEFTPQGLLLWEARIEWPNTTRDDRGVLFSQLYLTMGWLLVALGQYVESLNSLERGLSYTGIDFPDLARQAATPLKLTIARALLEKGDLQEAKQALSVIKNELDANLQPGFYVQRLELSGKLDLLQGNFGSAIEYFNKVLELCREKGFLQGALQASLNMAHILVYLNQTHAAQNMLAVAINKANQLNNGAIVARATYLMHVAQERSQSFAEKSSLSVSEILQPSHQLNQRAAVTKKNPPHLEQSANYLSFFEDRSLEFHWYVGNGQVAAAANFLQNMSIVFNLTDSKLIYIRLKVLFGMLFYYQGTIEKAVSELTIARLLLHEQDLKPELWQVQRFLIDCGKQLGRLETEQSILVKENDDLLNSLAESLSVPDQTLYLLNKWSADEEYLLTEINRLRLLKAKLHDTWFVLRPWRRWSFMQSLNSLLHHIDRYKDARTTQTIGENKEIQIARSSAPPLWHRLIMHPRNRATLSFLTLPDRVFVARISWLSLDFIVSPVTRAQIRNWVQVWHQQVAHINGQPRDIDAVTTGHRALLLVNGMSSRPTPEQISNEAKAVSTEITKNLAEAFHLSAILNALPKRICGLTIVPDDSLHGFPFAAIMYQGESIVKHYSLSVAYENRTKRPQIKKSGFQNALAVVVSQGAPGIPPLPGTERELEQVMAWFEKQKNKGKKLQVNSPLVNNTADKSTVLNQLSQITLLHMACHGIFERNQPDQSGLVLVPSRDNVQILSLRDLSRQDLRQLHHVTLSSCWSADHFVLPGRWVISLPETLWRAGAHSILGSLWEVSDQVAISFMARFYAYLDDYPRDEALRRTQLDCLARNLPGCENIDTSVPFYWAGYNLYGDHKKLRI